jgi:cell division septum initiation protein DivIVA
VLATVSGALRDEVGRAHAAEEARINEGWALLHQATERCRLLDQRATERREQARKEAEEIRASAVKEAEEALATARESARGVLARAHQEAMQIVSEARQKIPPTVGPPNPALAGEEAKRAAQHLLDEARTNADGLLANARQRLDEVEDREALLHAREESTDSRAESLSLQEAGLAAREAEVCERERGLRLREEQLLALEGRLHREREALESREALASQSNDDLTHHQEALDQREASLQAKADHMLNQRRVSMEQEFERRRAEFTEACRADFRAKTNDALAMYKRGRETLERQVRDLETELKGAHEARRGTERALAEADATLTSLQREAQRLEEENVASALQGVEISKKLQEAKDSETEALVLRRQRVQMFRGFSGRVMAAAHRLGIHGLILPTVPEDDGSILLFFSQLAEQLDDASAKVLELIDAECRELLGLAGTRIFTNLQRLRPDLNLEEVLRRPPRPPPGTPDRAATTRAEQREIALRRLQAIYARPGAPAAAGVESSSSGDTSGSEESGSEEAEEGEDGSSESSGDTSLGSSQSSGDDEGEAAVAQ